MRPTLHYIITCVLLFGLKHLLRWLCSFISVRCKTNIKTSEVHILLFFSLSFLQYSFNSMPWLLCCIFYSLNKLARCCPCVCYPLIKGIVSYFRETSMPGRTAGQDGDVPLFYHFVTKVSSPVPSRNRSHRHSQTWHDPAAQTVLHLCRPEAAEKSLF